jgi:hypothetical protein
MNSEEGVEPFRYSLYKENIILPHLLTGLEKNLISQFNYFKTFD